MRHPFAPTPGADRVSGSDLIAAIITTLMFWAISAGSAWLAVCWVMMDSPAPIPHWIAWGVVAVLALLSIGFVWLGARPFGLRPVIVRSPGRVGIAYETPCGRREIISRAAASRPDTLAELEAYLDAKING
nr:MAG TPA: hypothetical protein [Caudoviricetes sp.]